jgi:short-subunit dehydrogenase
MSQVGRKRVFITGISSGIGRHLALHLRDSYEVMGLSRRDPHIDGVRFFPCDLRNPREIEEVATALRAEGTAIDVLIHNA